MASDSESSSRGESERRGGKDHEHGARRRSPRGAGLPLPRDRPRPGGRGHQAPRGAGPELRRDTASCSRPPRRPKPWPSRTRCRRGAPHPGAAAALRGPIACSPATRTGPRLLAAPSSGSPGRNTISSSSTRPPRRGRRRSSPPTRSRSGSCSPPSPSALRRRAERGLQGHRGRPPSPQLRCSRLPGGRPHLRRHPDESRRRGRAARPPIPRAGVRDEDHPGDRRPEMLRTGEDPVPDRRVRGPQGDEQYPRLAFEVEQRVLNREEFLAGRSASMSPLSGAPGEDAAELPAEMLVVNR